MSITGAVISVSVFVIWTFIADALARRSRRSARVLAGEPVIVLRAGTPIDDRMTQERITVDDLKEAARMDGIADLADVEYAILETDGEFSFIKRDE
jgi:uncharacterized membrane protein YcaP (DUF421 family)